jgi:hypothetical protein
MQQKTLTRRSEGHQNYNPALGRIVGRQHGSLKTWRKFCGGFVSPMINPSSFGVLTSTQAFSGMDLQPDESSFNANAC